MNEEIKAQIADELERKARGLIVKGRSDREVQRLCSDFLERLTVEAGATLPQNMLNPMCKLSRRRARRFVEMKPVHEFFNDHKQFSDKHDFKVQRDLTLTPMEVLYGDVHAVDMSIEAARLSPVVDIRAAGKRAQQQGRVSIRVAIIGWMDGSSHYLWATPVILGPGQGITQQDVARSLFDVVTCPHGGIPRYVVIDNVQYRENLAA